MLARPAAADDLADEADLQFQLGADRYRDGDYRGALEHFLASNRLVPNHNVGFNIARSYEQLKQYPEAFRYYTQAMEGESDPQARERVQPRSRKSSRNVAVLRIETDPPGATIYIGRRDLGPRGTARACSVWLPATTKCWPICPTTSPPSRRQSKRRSPGKRGTPQARAQARRAHRNLGGERRRARRADRSGRAPARFHAGHPHLPAGPHKVKISLKGFRPSQQNASDRPNQRPRIDSILVPTQSKK